MKNPHNPDVGDTIREGPYKGFQLVSKYTSGQAVEDGLLFDVDLLAKSGEIPIKYITTGLLEKGYWNDRCANAVKREEAGKNDRCASCEVFIYHHGEGKLGCTERSLNGPNVLDLLTAALRIFSKKPVADWFVSGMLELPSGQKQKVFIAQNETGRYTLMLPEDY